MITVKEQVVKQLDTLSEVGLQNVANYIAYLKFQERFNLRPRFDEAQLADLYAEFANEDQELAEAGMNDYVAALTREDAQ